MKYILSQKQISFCKSMTYLFWWKSPAELAARPERTLAGVMDRGGMAEWNEMEKTFPPVFIAHILESAKCGEFHSWSWKFWRLRYGLDPNTPLPSRLPGIAPPAGDDWFKKLQRRKNATDNDYERLKWTFPARGIEVKHGV